MGKDETIIVSTNRNPARVKTLPYFENRAFKKMAKLAPAKLKARTISLNEIPLLRI